jgi:Flp pilus assembly protein TadG
MLGSFLRDRQGSILPMFALSLVMLCGTVGLSVDGARVYGAKQKLQAAVDSAVLAAARRAMADGDTDDVTEAFERFLAATLVDPEIRLRSTTADLSVPRRVSAEIVADVSTLFMPVLGLETVEIRVGSSAAFTFTRLEIALALDNTGSMLGAKLDALKISAKRMVEDLLDKAPNTGDTRFALVPFAQYVNVGTGNRNAPWISVPVDPLNAWNGCVGPSPLNTQDGSYGTRVPGILGVMCPSPIQPLTASRTELANAIDGMTAEGATYVPAGLMWGWRVLSTQPPFTESAGDRVDGEGNKINKVLILMTDGENTASPSYPGHDGTDASLANQLTAQSCEAIKADRIRIFTIAFDVTSNPIKDLLRVCASSPGLFFDAADAGQLDAAMQAIGSQLGGLRLTN